MISVFDRLKGFVSLMRPAEWSKSFGNMVIAAVTAAFYFEALIPVPVLIIGMVSVVLLWSGLYALNDFIDWEADSKHQVKKNRAIPAGLVSPKGALTFSLALLFCSFGIAFALQSSLLLLCLIVMFANQILYTVKPFDFKKRAFLDMLSGSLVNPVFRFYAGWVLVMQAFNAPLFPLLFVTGLQFGGYGLYRLISAEHDKKLGYKSTVVLFSEKLLKPVFYFSIALSGIAFVAMILAQDFFPQLMVFGFLSFNYIWLVVGSLLLVPLYWKPMAQPGKADMQAAYRVLYVHYVFFIAGFWLLFYF